MAATFIEPDYKNQYFQHPELSRIQGEPTTSALSTLQQAIRKGHLLTWPGIEHLNFEKILRATVSSAKGHLDQERQNLQSTKPTIDDDFYPTDGTTKTYEYASIIVPFAPKMKTYMDLTGRFPYKSSSGNEYMYVMYDFDSNAIFGLPIKNRQAKTLATAWETLHQRLTSHGHPTKHFVLDNEISAELKAALKKYNFSFELTPPHMHRRNAAERAIRTFKNHFMAGLASCHPDFPLTEWDKLIPQANIKLNLLRSSRVNPKLSAYAYINGNYNFNAHPLAPPDTRVVLHKKPDQRDSWEYHGVEAFIVGPSLHHYRCFQCYVPTTGALIHTDTVVMIPHTIPIPTYNDATAVRQAISDIIHIIKNSEETNIPKFWRGDAIQQAFQQLSDAINQKDVITTPAVTLPIVSKPSSQQPPASVSPALRPITPPPTSQIPTIPPLPPNLPAALPRVVPEPRVVKPTPWYPSTAPTWRPSLVLNHIYDASGKKQSIDDLITGPKSNTWLKSTANELGRLANGIPGRVRGTQCVVFIPKDKVPKGKKVTHANMVCDYRPLKDEPWRVRLTIGGDKLDYDQETASPAANLLETKLLINSVISVSHKGARFLGIDIKDFFLLTFLPEGEREYMRIHSKYFNDEMRQLYNIDSIIAEDGFVYCEIQRGMYGLKQAAILAYQQLKVNLERHGYYPIPLSDGLWAHKTRKTIFALCVDDFGVKYFNRDDANHLIETLQKYYPISLDWDDKNYCGLSLHWHYGKGYVDIDMPGYIDDVLKKHQHPKPATPQYAPHRWNKPAYGRQTQFAPEQDRTPKLDAKKKQQVQSIVGSLLYYGRAIDPSILPALNEIFTEQANPTENTMKKRKMLLDYMHTYPNARMRYIVGTMQLMIDSDAAYLVLPNARSRFAGHFMLEARPNKYSEHDPPLNAPILIQCKTIKKWRVLSS